MSGSGRAAALCFAQGETQVIVMFPQQLARVPGIQPAEQHQDRGAAVLMAAGQCRFCFTARAVGGSGGRLSLPPLPARSVGQ